MYAIKCIFRPRMRQVQMYINKQMMMNVIKYLLYVFYVPQKTNSKLAILLNLQTDERKQRKTTSDGTTRML